MWDLPLGPGVTLSPITFPSPKRIHCSKSQKDHEKINMWSLRKDLFIHFPEILLLVLSSLFLLAQKKTPHQTLEAQKKTFPKCHWNWSRIHLPRFRRIQSVLPLQNFQTPRELDDSWKTSRKLGRI